MREKGLGTPATRAAIIEGLIYEQYLLRNGRELQATAKAFSLMELLNGLGIPELTKPELTGDWEFKLHQMQRRQKSRDEFMSEIADMTRHIVDRAKKYEHDTIPGDFGVLKMPCPKCGGEVHEKYKAVPVPEMRFLRSGKRLAAACSRSRRWRSSFTEKQIGPLQGFRSKMGRPFAAVHQTERRIQAGIRFRPGPENENGEVAAPVDFTGKEPLGKCPQVRRARVRRRDELRLRKGDRRRTRRAISAPAKSFCSRQSRRSRCRSCLPTGKTDLLTKFISKNGRPFKAFLVVGKDGKVGVRISSRAKPKRKAGGERKPKAPAPKIDFTGKEPLGKCPKCGGQVFETEAAYVCEKSQADKRPCKFKISKDDFAAAD